MPDFSFADRLGNAWARSWPRRKQEIRLDRPLVSFSFDDVPLSAYRNGAPILEDEGVRGTFYAAGGLAGRMHDGVEIMDAEDYAALAGRGHEVAHHGFSHRRPIVLARRFEADVTANDAFLAENISGPVRNYAFPYGLSSPRARRVLARRFRSLRSAEVGLNAGVADLDYLRAVDICEGVPRGRLSQWIAEAVAARAWLIFLTHDVRDGHGTFGCTPALLRGLVREALAAGCEVLPVDAALDRIGAPLQ